jgi:hypothetical protein
MVFAVVWPLIGRAEQVHGAWVKGMHEGIGSTESAIAREWLRDCLTGLNIVFFIWLQAVVCNHYLVRREQQKEFRSAIVLLTVIMAASAVYFVPVHIGLFAAISIVALTAVVQTFLELTRKFVAKEEHRQVALEGIRPGDPFYYREIAFAWWWVAPAVYISLGLILLGWEQTQVWPYAVAAVVLATVPLPRDVFIVSSERIVARVWLHRVSIRKTDVKSCKLVDYDARSKSIAGTRDYSAKLLVPQGKSGPCLEIVTNKGEAYILGMNNSETACKLIQTALEARGNG